MGTVLQRRAFAAMAVVAAAPLVAPALAEDRISLIGSSTIGAELAPALVEAYALDRGLTLTRDPQIDPSLRKLRLLRDGQPVAEVDIVSANASAAFEALGEGAAAIGMASRRARGDEVDRLAASAGVDITEPGAEHVIALDGIVVIVAPENPALALTLEEIAEVFSGRIDDWSALGLPGGPISVHARDIGSGTYDTFSALVLEPFGRTMSSRASRYESNEGVVAAVAREPGAIGFAPLAYADQAGALSIALPCGVVVGPTEFAVQSEEYPLGRRLYLYTLGPPADATAADFIDFAGSDAAQPVVDAAGFVNQGLLQQDLSAYSDHLIGAMQGAQSEEERAAVRSFAEATRDGVRLSTTFRFARGGDLLDPKAIADAGRIARWLESAENDDARITLMGFADSRGGFDSNLPLSIARAEAVRRAILVQVAPDFDAGRIATRAFSTIAPVACNDDEAGRAKNRRVEVWLTR